MTGMMLSQADDQGVLVQTRRSGSEEKGKGGWTARPSLVVMAAGMGSRYGGLKQIDPVGPNGERIIDYSLYDAARAGFGKVVFIIRRDIEKAFRDAVQPSSSLGLEVETVFQDLDDLPGGHTVPPGRTKPWGTGQAVLACRGAVREPFGVINADDFYGRDAFEQLKCGLDACPPDQDRQILVTYELANTLSDNGSVSRGVCVLDMNARLTHIEEFPVIRRDGPDIIAEMNGRSSPLSPKTPVSMNLWGFTPRLFHQLERRFLHFLDQQGGQPRAEFFIPSAINDMVQSGLTEVIVASTSSTWLGMTYAGDRDTVRAGIADLINRGEYPSPLW